MDSVRCAGVQGFAPGTRQCAEVHRSIWKSDVPPAFSRRRLAALPELFRNDSGTNQNSFNLVMLLSLQFYFLRVTGLKTE